MMPTARTLGEMVDAVLMQAGPAGMRKLAQEATGSACEKCSKPAMEGSPLCRECAQEQSNKETDKEDGTEKTSSQRIQKLASAVAYIVNNFNGLPFQTPVGRVKIGQAPSEASDIVGAGKGPNALPTTLDAPTTGEQGTVAGEAKVDTIPTTPPLEEGATPLAAQNAMETNIDDFPSPYPEDGVMKQARANRMRAVLRKLAGNENSPAQVLGPKSSVLPEEVPSQVARPSELTSQERLINSADAAINYTKSEAKKPAEKTLEEVLSEKPQDTAEVLRPVLGEAVKEAQLRRQTAARVLLEKIAREGCTCQGNSKTGECRFCKVAAKVQKMKKQCGSGPMKKECETEPLKKQCQIGPAGQSMGSSNNMSQMGGPFGSQAM